MSAITMLRDLVLTRPAIAAVVQERVNPLQHPQGAALPAVVLSLVDERDDRLLSGQARYPVARFIVDCLGATFAEADALGEVVKAQIGDFAGPIAGVRAEFSTGDTDFHDRGEAGTHYRRRLGFEARFRAL